MDGFSFNLYRLIYLESFITACDLDTFLGWLLEKGRELGYLLLIKSLNYSVPNYSRLQMFDKLTLSIKTMTLIFLKARSKWPNFRIFKWQKSILYELLTNVWKGIDLLRYIYGTHTSRLLEKWQNFNTTSPSSKNTQKKIKKTERNKMRAC